MKTSHMTYSLVIPHVPVSGNKFWRKHWRDRQDMIGEWGLLVANAIQHSGQAQFNRFKVDATIYFKDNRVRDIPNFMTTVDKLILDHLTHQKIIPDDDSRHMPEITLRFALDRHNPRTEIVITEL